MRKTYTSSKVKARWNKKNYDRTAALIPKAHEETLKKYAAEHHLSINGLVNDLLRREMGISETEWNPKVTTANNPDMSVEAKE